MKTESSPRIRVLIADDHAVVRSGVRMVLACEPDMEVIGEGGNGREARRLARRLRPDIVLMDLSMDQLNGISATRHIVRECARTKVIAFSCYAETTMVQEALAAGALGYVLKNTSLNELMQAVREVHLGNGWFSPRIAWQLAISCRPSGLEEGRRKLTTREAQVLQLLAEGHHSEAIAGDLEIRTETVEKHRLNLMRKLDLHCIPELIRYAAENHITEAQPGLRRVGT